MSALDRFTDDTAELVFEDVRKYDPDQPRDDHGRWTAAEWASDVAASRSIHGSEREVLTGTFRFPPDGLSMGEQATMRAYTNTSYGHINRYLAGRSVVEDHTKEIGQVAELDSAIGKYTVERDLAVWRVGRDWQRVAWKKDDVGRQISFKTFLSTSLVQAKTLNFTSEEGGAADTHYKILVPEGAHALPIYALDTTGLPSEKEVLLPRGSKFTVENVDQRRHTVTLRMDP